VLRALAPLVDATTRVVVVGTPDDGAPALHRWLGARWPVEPQGDGDLGARMRRAVARHLDAGAGRVVVVGTDCPEVDARVVRGALARLDAHDAVFGPAADGGYYLVGVRRAAAGRALGALFDEVPWSAAETLAVSLARAGSAGLSVALLPELCDVDTAADWHAWRARRRARTPHPLPEARP
jgi:rSAM/selenodomain-associated transferase 1